MGGEITGQFSGNFHMWMTFVIIGVAIIFYAFELARLELTSLAVIVFLLLGFELIPPDAGLAGTLPDARELLSGFADPALITVLALLVIGQALIHTAALDGMASAMVTAGGSRPALLISAILVTVLLLSAFLNNTPVVVIFIPVLSALSAKLGRSVSKVMIPLSFVAILGGNLTLIGSSTNLLVAGTMAQSGAGELAFFDLAVPGGVFAVFGLLYIFFIVPSLLKDRAGMASQMTNKRGGHQFIVQVQLDANSPFLGLKSTAGMFPGLRDITVRMIQRGEQVLLPPFDDVELGEKDIMVI